MAQAFSFWTSFLPKFGLLQRAVVGSQSEAQDEKTKRQISRLAVLG